MITAAIGAGTALLSAIGAGIASGAHNRNYRRMINGELADNQRWHDVKMAEDYTLRTDNQANINKLRESLLDADKATRKRQVVSGGSDEAVALQKAGVNKTVSDATVNMAMQASAEKDQADREYRAKKSALNQQLAQSEQQQAAQIAQAGSQAVNAGINLAGNAIAMQGATPNPGAGHTPAGLNASGQLTSGNTDLTSLGNAQFGINSDGLPTPRTVGEMKPPKKINA